jgi:hypothetical protein
MSRRSALVTAVLRPIRAQAIIAQQVGREGQLLSAQGISIGLGAAISTASVIVLFGRDMHSRSKIDVFWLILASICLLALVGLIANAWRLLPLLALIGWLDCVVAESAAEVTELFRV